MGWLLGALQLSDTFYPTGAYAHSFGLEGLVEQGVVRDRATLREFFLRSVEPALRQAELPLVIHAWAALGACERGLARADVNGDADGGAVEAGDERAGRGEEVNWGKVGELCVLASALKSAREARVAADNIGRQRVELLVKLRAYPLAVEFARRSEAGKWPGSPAIAAALEARVLGAPLEAALASVYYAAIAGPLAAAMKILRLGQNGAQTLLTELLARGPAAIAAAREVKADAIGWFNPWLDIAAARHERAAARLFIS